MRSLGVVGCVFSGIAIAELSSARVAATAATRAERAGRHGEHVDVDRHQSDLVGRDDDHGRDERIEQREQHRLGHHGQLRLPRNAVATTAPAMIAVGGITSSIQGTMTPQNPA